jgi:Spy/CpxP family protein refolding chaperone
MKIRWITGIVMAGAMTLPAMAQAGPPKPPAVENPLTADSSEQQAPDSPASPEDKLKVYEEQMAVVTVETCTELEQIAEAVRAGKISSKQGEYLTLHGYEVALIRFQYLGTLHEILEANVSSDDKDETGEATPTVQLSRETIVIAPPDSSPDIPESTAKYLELTPVQIAMIQARIAEERKEVHPLLQQLSAKQQALSSAMRGQESSDKHIQRLAAEQSRILERLTVANARLQRDIYQFLTAAQREKVDHMPKNASALMSPLLVRQ